MHVRTTRRFAALSLFVGVLLGSALASADETYVIKLRVTAGEKWSFDLSSTMKQHGQVTANGQLAQPIDMSMEQRRKGTIEVLSVEGGLPTALRIFYDPESSNSGKGAPQQAPPFPLAGKTVTVRKDGDKVTIEGADQVDEQTSQELHHMLEPDTSIYPKSAVALNQEWEGDTVSLAKQFQLGADDKVSLKCRLLGVKDEEGRPVAAVSVVGQIIKHDQGFIETKTTLGGVSEIDLQSGQTISGGVIGKLVMSGSKQVTGDDGKPVNVAVSADGELQVHQLVKILNAGGAAPAPGPAPVGGFNVASNPPAPVGVNPFWRGTSFAGAYKGDQLALDLSGDAGQYTGTLVISDKKFPVTARGEGNKLTGTFESDGAKFNFTAALENGVLNLNSDGSTYVLKKAAVNPLARPQPKNPLAQ